MLIQRLSEMQISVDTIDKNYLKGFPKQRLLKLNVSNVKEDRIEEGIRKVMEEIKQVERLNFQFKKNKMIFLEHSIAECSFYFDISNLNGNKLPINVKLKSIFILNRRVMKSMAVRIVDDLQQLSLLLMFLSTFIFYRYLKKVKRDRKLTGFEWTMYFVTQFATLIWAMTYFIKHLAES